MVFLKESGICIGSFNATLPKTLHNYLKLLHIIKSAPILRNSAEFRRIVADFTNSTPHRSFHWRRQSKLEVDLVISDTIVIEIKASKKISSDKLKGQCTVAEEVPLKLKTVVALEPEWRRLDDGIEIIPVETFLKQLWSDELKSDL